MHQDARPPFAATPTPPRGDASAAAWAQDRDARLGRGGATASSGHDAERDPADRPVLPPPLGGAGRPGGDGGDGGGVPSPRPGVEPDSMRVIEILSHELRSPITTIHLGAKVLREQGDRISQPVHTEVVEAVEEEAERLYRLVEDLLAVARHEGGAAPLPVGPIALQHWLPTVVAAEVHIYPALRVRASIPSGLPPVLADDGALAHVFRNLLANVTRHAPHGMPAEIVAWPSEASTVRLEVLDRGPGVQPDEAATLFEPFYRSPAAMALGSGAGLGLAAAQRLMRAMNGAIEAQPRAGGGARFVLTLPVAAADADLDEDAAWEASASDPHPDAGSTAA